MSDVLALTIDLCRRASVTPDDAGCQALLAQRLGAAGFAVESLRFGEVDNLWATHGSGTPVVVLLGHTDVVPTGPLELWTTPPFEPTLADGMLRARGAADMKGSVAAMTLAAEAFVRAHPSHRGTLALLLTSDEEGDAKDGVKRVLEAFAGRGQRIDCCIVGEPTSVDWLGDMLKNGRRGSLSGKLTVRGIQGHVAYPHLDKNPVHLLAPALAELAKMQWDKGNESFPPTTWQVSNIHAGTGAGNVIPGTVQVDFNFRFSTESTDASLKQRVESILKKNNLEFSVDWVLGAKPFLSRNGRLASTVREASKKHTGRSAELSTTGGTSDARFIIEICPEVIELGPVNASIHKLNEHIELSQLEVLPRIYLDTLRSLLP